MLPNQIWKRAQRFYLATHHDSAHTGCSYVLCRLLGYINKTIHQGIYRSSILTKVKEAASERKQDKTTHIIILLNVDSRQGDLEGWSILSYIIYC